MDGTVLGGAFMLWGPALSLEEERVRAGAELCAVPWRSWRCGCPPEGWSGVAGYISPLEGHHTWWRGALEGGIEASLCVLQGACGWNS